MVAFSGFHWVLMSILMASMGSIGGSQLVLERPAKCNREGQGEGRGGYERPADDDTRAGMGGGRGGGKVGVGPLRRQCRVISRGPRGREDGARLRRWTSDLSGIYRRRPDRRSGFLPLFFISLCFLFFVAIEFECRRRTVFTDTDVMVDGIFFLRFEMMRIAFS